MVSLSSWIYRVSEVRVRTQWHLHETRVLPLALHLISRLPRGSRKNSWNINPILWDLTPDNWSSDIPTTFLPSMNIEPLLGVERVPIMCKSVVFPLPEDPMIPNNSPVNIEIDTSERAWTVGGPGYTLLIASNLNAIFDDLLSKFKPAHWHSLIRH